MDTHTNDYRLERWLAVLLALLFFLPFVAKADDVVFANASYHGGEMRLRNGEEFLAFHDDVLVPVRIQVWTQEDPLVDVEGRRTGKRVSLPGFDEYTLLVRGTNLHPGKITPATPDYAELPRDGKVTLTLGTATSKVYYRCDAATCTVVLETDGVMQRLVTLEKEMLQELQHVINFAGDLDHDGKLDLVMNTSTHWNETRPTLFLSSVAKEGKLVGRSAELVMTGC
jgi:hypothetical protein